MKINRDNIRKNSKIVYYNYKFGDEAMLNNKAAYKYETPYNGRFEMMLCWTNAVVILQMVGIEN